MRVLDVKSVNEMQCTRLISEENKMSHDLKCKICGAEISSEEENYYGHSICANCGDNIPCHCRRNDIVIDIDSIMKLVPDGYEIIRVGRPKIGEKILGGRKDVYTVKSSDTQYVQVIVEKKRWRGKKEETYYYVNHIGYVIEEYDYYANTDDERFKYGNYFKTRREATRISGLIKDIYEEYIKSLRELP